MDAVLVIASYVAVGVLVIRVLTAMLLVALVLQATVSDRIGAYAALGLTVTGGHGALAVQFGMWVGADGDA